LLRLSLLPQQEQLNLVELLVLQAPLEQRVALQLVQQALQLQPPQLLVV
jgi:hypothetical protein